MMTLLYFYYLRVMSSSFLKMYPGAHVFKTQLSKYAHT
jgi:hypothetical protein